LSEDGNSICRLCLREDHLLESHIIPKFVFRWMKDTGGSDFLRSAIDINRRTQDGPTASLLCEDCEIRFSKWEKRFADNYFFPSSSKGGFPSTSYSEWCCKFLASVVWRYGLWFLEETESKRISCTQKELVEGALEIWRKFLMGELPHPNENEIHILPVGEFTSLQHPNIPPNWNRYIKRTTECDIAFTDDNSFIAIFVKMGPIAVFGHVTNAATKWQGSRVSIRQGNYVQKIVLQPSVLDFLVGRAQISWSLRDQLSDKQKSKVNSSIRKNVDRLAGSDLYEEIQNDFSRFGQAAFKED